MVSHKALNTLPENVDWRHFDSIDSTNAYLMANDSHSPMLVSADRQTHGRGRRQQAWIDEGRSALFSLSTFFEKGADISAWPVQVALSLSACLNQLLLDHQIQSSVKIKWPNDLYSCRDQQWGKCGGILVETAIGKRGKIVTGIGINLAPINTAIGADYDASFIDLPLAPKTLIVMLANRLFSDWAQFISTERIDTEAYRAVDYLWKQALVATDMHSERQVYGLGGGINDKGHLLLKQDEKTLALTAQQRIRFAHE